MENPEYLTDDQCVAHMIQIAKLLNSISISQVSYILSGAESLIFECHTVDTENPRFKAKIHELEGSGIFFG